MGYKVLGKTEELFRGYGPRKGLEGPFIKGANRIVYYDPKEGAYWDPTTDFYLSQDEVELLDRELMRMLAR
jgi:hypothetical protein